jgi:hypothetical protein
MAAEAAVHPNGWVYEIDVTQVPDPQGYVPPEAIIGAFAIGPDGQGTGEFARNPGHGPVRDDFSKLEAADHWFGWLPETPASAVRSRIASGLAEQVPGTEVEWLKIVDEPVFLTSGFKRGDTAEGEARLLINRAAFAVIFVLATRSPTGSRETLTGAFSWVATGLAKPNERKDRIWIDLRMNREQAEGLLRQRIYDGTASAS